MADPSVENPLIPLAQVASVAALGMLKSIIHIVAGTKRCKTTFYLVLSLLL